MEQGLFFAIFTTSSVVFCANNNFTLKQQKDGDPSCKRSKGYRSNNKTISKRCHLLISLKLFIQEAYSVLMRSFLNGQRCHGSSQLLSFIAEGVILVKTCITGSDKHNLIVFTWNTYFTSTK